MAFFRKFVHVIYEFIESFVISASFFVVIYLFLMQPHQVKGSSMFPTYKDKEYLFMNIFTDLKNKKIKLVILLFFAFHYKALFSVETPFIFKGFYFIHY